MKQLLQTKKENNTEGEVIFISIPIEIYKRLELLKKYYHPDHLGSTSLITNSTGGIVEETFYLPFGDVISGGNESRYEYEGKEEDDTGKE